VIRTPGGASLNNRATYVGPTSGREEIRVYCNDKERMVRDLSRDVSHRSAIEQPSPKPQQSFAVGRS
jgi:hypothetical protein